MQRNSPWICGGHSRPIPDVRYSPPTDDGIFMISACLDGKPMLRRGETGDWVGTFEGHKGAVWSACMNSAATRAVTGSADFTAKLWDTISGLELQTFKHGHIIKAVDFCKDGTRFLTAGHEKVIRLFDASNYDSDPIRIEGAAHTIKVAIFAGPPHGADLILVGLQDSSGVHVWDLRTKSVVKVLPTPSPVSSIEVSEDGNTIAVASGKQAQFCDMSSLEMQKEFRNSFVVESVSLSRDKTKFVAGCSDNWVRVLNFDNGKEIDCLKGHHGPVHCVRFCPNGETFASGSEDGTIRIWNCAAYKSDAVNNGGAAPSPTPVAASPDVNL
mmetsp:Transcript_4137/g.7242  ORF Transcript_4137/g.7242 Transcript_4137/m.7242 type:complete len:327 (+) Transcript_4137:147-1127(+)|eukprot:CAMPEP_0196655816 /NCGR_PEP_ID=MMETSP1086-20130531/8663_1 /TAXON_ID=77921 /ORGANISM="Cyanoptyche  gloeocystis , Strain SAG4.97" /LENGTH=326 /DNA_ID=CAMNT_0041988319 /DNA_START=142 /DNA_END=1122 /DNA_ORIENTATION=+